MSKHIRRADHPGFHDAWETLQRKIVHIQALAHDSQALRADYEFAIDNAKSALERLRDLITPPVLHVGDRVTVANPSNGRHRYTGTVLQAESGMARVTFHRLDTLGLLFSAADLEPADEPAAPAAKL